MAKMLRVKRMALGQFANLMNALFADDFIGTVKPFKDERLPVLFGNRSERIVTPGTIHEHFLDQMLTATEKNVAHLTVVLDDTSQLPLHLIAAIFENLLKLIKHHYDALSALDGNLGRGFENLVQCRTELGALAESECQLRLAFLVHCHAGGKIAEKLLPGFQKFLH